MNNLIEKGLGRHVLMWNKQLCRGKLYPTVPNSYLLFCLLIMPLLFYHYWVKQIIAVCLGNIATLGAVPATINSSVQQLIFGIRLYIPR